MGWGAGRTLRLSTSSPSSSGRDGEQGPGKHPGSIRARNGGFLLPPLLHSPTKAELFPQCISFCFFRLFFKGRTNFLMSLFCRVAVADPAWQLRQPLNICDHGVVGEPFFFSSRKLKQLFWLPERHRIQLWC